MALDWKKIMLGLGFILLIGLIGFGIWYVFFRPIVAPPSAPLVTPEATGGLPSAGTSGSRPVAGGLSVGDPLTSTSSRTTTRASSTVTRVTDDRVSHMTLTAEGEPLYYDPAQSRFYRVRADGSVEALSNKQFYNVSNVTWSPDQERAVLEYPDGSNIVYDFTTNRQVTLPAHWRDFSFAPNGENLAFKSIGLDPENRFLAVSRFDGSQSTVIENLGTKDDSFISAWSPNNQIVGMFTEGRDAGRSEVFFIGLNNENYKSLITNGYGFEGTWSPTGEQLVYSVYNPTNGYRPELWISDAAPASVGANRQPLNLQTWADKCAFRGTDSLVCAVPQTLPYGAGLSRTEGDTGGDTIYEINLTTGARRAATMPANTYAIDSLTPSPDGTVYFHDRVTGRIYNVRLD